MVVMILERVSPSLRGELTRWLLEPKAGVFVGTVSALVRDKLWELVGQRVGSGGGILVHTTDNEQGFALQFRGDTTRLVRDFDGLSLVTVPPKQS
ncbi:MAG: type I-E CRISPR-associated endoribonuclease Cas2 [Dehalococcoidia bacterium]|nr:type I-E CRISPR-associated endoribonuclease Cas2 [Dehalococcoidia bacterium]